MRAEAVTARRGRQNLTDALSLRQQPEAQSHTAGFDAWLRSREAGKARAPPCCASFAAGRLHVIPPSSTASAFSADDRSAALCPLLRCDGFVHPVHSCNPLRQVYTADDVIEQFGVSKQSYEPVILPNIKAYQANTTGGSPFYQPHPLSLLLTAKRQPSWAALRPVERRPSSRQRSAEEKPG